MVKKLEVNGGLRKKAGGIALTIYSMPLARYLFKNNFRTLEVCYKNRKIIVRHGTKNKLHFERLKQDNPLGIIYVARLLPYYLKEEIKNSKKQKRIGVIVKNIITNKELIKYNNQIRYKEAENLDTNIPQNEKINLACHISCFRNKSSLNYRINIKHRILKEIALRKEKVLICRNKKGDFIMRKKSEGIPFSFYECPRGYPLAYM